jgi:glycosyltransferase involved in cell wall biosynthesis
MNLVLVAEGARIEMGGLGLVAVPPIARALAGRGHRVVLEIFGPVIPGAESFVTHDPSRAFRSDLVAISYPARGRFAFAPGAVPALRSHVAGADFVMLHSLYSFAVLSGYGAARMHGKKYGVWPHGVLAPFQRSVSARRKAVYNRLAGKRIMDDAAVIFYNAAGERDEAAVVQPAHVPSVIIPHGIDLEPFSNLPARGSFRAKYLNGFDGPLVLYLGRLNAKKGLDLLVQAMRHVHAHMSGTRLAIVGAGDPPEFAKQVANWVQEAGLAEVVVMPGLMMGDAKLAALADADVAVLPSQQENFSFAMFEALASRLPVVISDGFNFAPEVERFRAGRVVSRAADAFARAILDVLENPEAARRMGERGAQLAAQYSWGAVGKQLERAIQALVTNQPLPRDLVLGQVPS